MVALELTYLLTLCAIPVNVANTSVGEPGKSQRVHRFDNFTFDLLNGSNVDIEKLDVERFKRKMLKILEQFKDDEPRGPTRREGIHDREGLTPMYQAERHRIKRKAADMALQLLYMARHKLRMMERSEFFDTKSFGFRIAYCFRRVQRLWRNVNVLYRKQWEYTQYNATEQFIYIRLHHKAARLHVDFIYLFWIMLKLDVSHRERKRRSELLELLKEGSDMPEGYSLPETWG